MSGILPSAEIRKDSSSKCFSLASSGIFSEVSTSGLDSFAGIEGGGGFGFEFGAWGGFDDGV